MRNESPEEHGEGHPRPPRGGSGKWDGGGFREGEGGRGPTPYTKSDSPKPGGHSISTHMSDSGRGGSGIIGKGDSFKGHSQDIEHPCSHGDFEKLGAD